MPKLNRHAYESLIEADKVELRRSHICQPEKMHIETVLDWSVEQLYPRENKAGCVTCQVKDGVCIECGWVLSNAEPKVDLADTIGATAPPARYNKDGERECIDLMHDLLGDEGFIAYCRGQVLKYTYRAGLKDPAPQDIKKAEFYRDMANHVLAPHAFNDPRTYRADHVKYVRQPFEFGAHPMVLETWYSHTPPSSEEG